jgi:hypothetical protein
MYLSIIEVGKEPSLELEDWMIHENSFSVISTYTIEETEENLELEDWMIHKNNFPVHVNSLLETEEESTLELEDWMLNENSFSVIPICTIEEAEESLELEDWMVNDFFCQPKICAENLLKMESEAAMELENWMLDYKCWENLK